MGQQARAPLGVVTSYPNPDTDGVACGLTLARLLPGRWKAVFCGRLGEETRSALACAGLEPPAFADAVRGDRLALVDTHDPAQLPPGADCRRVLAIVDHHPAGDESAFPHAAVQNRAVGAAATLLAADWLRRPRRDVRLTKLLALAIASNTLNFTAPSTAQEDLDAYGQLTRLAPVSAGELTRMFACRAAVLQEGLGAALLSGLKQYDTGPCGPMAISQLELFDLLAHMEGQQVQAALGELSARRQLPLLLFNGVDLARRASLVVCANEASRQLAQQLLRRPFEGMCAVFPEILLRKTHFLAFDRP